MTGQQLGKSKERCWLFIACALLIVILFTAVFVSLRDGWGPDLYSQDDIINWTNWHLQTADGSLIPLSLPCRVPAAAGESVTMVSVIPAHPYIGLSLSFPSNRQRIVVDLAGQTVYDSVADDSVYHGNTPAPTWNFVSLYGAEAGQRLSITFSSPYGITSGLLPEILAGNRSDLKVQAVLNFLPNYIVSTTLLLTAALMLIIFLMLDYWRQGRNRLLYLGVFLLLLTVLLRLQLYLPQIFILNAANRDMLASLLLRLLPLIYVLYFRVRIGEEPFGVCALFFWLFFANFCLSVLLDLFGWLDFFRTAPVTHGLILLFLAVVFFFYFRGVFGRLFPVNHIETIGLLCFSASVILSMVAFYCPTLLSRVQWLQWGATAYVLAVVITTIQNQARINTDRLRIAKDLQKSQLQLLVGQIKPHFIYNTLSAIRALIAEDPAEASRMVYYFSHYLRGNIDALTINTMLPFSQELQHIRTYTSLEQLRFRERLHMVYDVRCLDFALPPLTIQPLVENAVKHGVSRRPQGGVVTLTTERQGNQVLVRVEDDGLGFDSSQSSGGAGLRNITLRLREQCGAELHISSRPGEGTVAWVLLPAAPEAPILSRSV